MRTARPCRDDCLLYECYLDAGMTHSETILPLIDNCLKFCHLTCADIDVYGVNAGPGSLTGLRIGLAAARWLAFPRELCGWSPRPWKHWRLLHWWRASVLCALDRAQAYSCCL